MRRLLRFLCAPEAYFVLPFLWIIGFSWPLVAAPGSFSSGGLMLFLVVFWVGVITILALMGSGYPPDETGPEEER